MISHPLFIITNFGGRRKQDFHNFDRKRNFSMRGYVLSSFVDRIVDIVHTDLDFLLDSTAEFFPAVVHFREFSA